MAFLMSFGSGQVGTTQASPRIVVPALGLLLALAPAGARAQPPPKEIEYVYPDQSVWTARRNQTGEPDNPLLHMAATLFAKAGIPWRAKSYPAARMYEYLQNGTAEFSMLVKAPALEECCLVSARPVAGTELRIYRRAGQAPIRARTDLAGRGVITILGYSYAGLLSFIQNPANRIDNNAATTHEAAFAMLDRGRAEYLVDYAGPAAEVLAAHPVKDLQYDVIGRLEVYLVLSRSYPDAAAVMTKLEAIAETLHRDESP